MIANQSGAIYGPTAGIARNLQTNINAFGASTASATSGGAGQPFAATGQGGGDLNGTQALILHGQSGTDATRWQMPRKFSNPGNWCGII